MDHGRFDDTGLRGAGLDDRGARAPGVAAITARSRVTSDVLDYWQRLRPAGGGLPRRMDIDPRQLGDALPYAFVLEQIAPGIARFRAAGQHLHDLMGRSVSGMPITAFCAPGQKARMLPLLGDVFETPSLLALDLVAHRAGKPPKGAEMLLLPLLDRTGVVSRALGCLVARGPVIFTPYRFEITSVYKTPLPSPVTPKMASASEWTPTLVPWLHVVK